MVGQSFVLAERDATLLTELEPSRKASTRGADKDA